MSALQRLQNHMEVSAPGKEIPAFAIVRPGIVISLSHDAKVSVRRAPEYCQYSQTERSEGSCNGEADL